MSKNSILSQLPTDLGDNLKLPIRYARGYGRAC